jgi:hypothetical protein
MTRVPTRLLRVLAIVCLVTGPLAGAATPPETCDGLEYRKTKGLDAVYVRPGADIKAYKNLVLAPVQVAFDKDWDPNSATRGADRRMSAEDMQQIRDEMASEFRRIFAEELAAAGYDVVAKPLDDTMVVAAGLADVYLNAPDQMTSGRSYTVTMNAGRMTLVMELRDGPSGQLLARVVDRYAGRQTGNAMIANKVTNSAEFRQAVTAWAKRLVDGLDRLKGKAD